MEASEVVQHGNKSKEEINALFAQHVSRGKAAFFKFTGIDFVLGKREGLYIWDSDP